MSDLDDRFAAAAEAANTLAQRPDNETMLKLYSLFKQASSGDVSGKRPGFTNMVGRAKFDAWSGLKGTSQDDAKSAYIDLVTQLGG